jgi:hypothetical protein
MTRREALAAAACAIALLTAGLVWLTGPWGLLVSSVLVGVLLLLVDVREE